MTTYSELVMSLVRSTATAFRSDTVYRVTTAGTHDGRPDAEQNARTGSYSPPERESLDVGSNGNVAGSRRNASRLLSRSPRPSVHRARYQDDRRRISSSIVTAAPVFLRMRTGGRPARGNRRRAIQRFQYHFYYKRIASKAF